MEPIKDSYSPTYEFEVLDIKIKGKDEEYKSPERVKDGDTIVCAFRLPFDKADLLATIRWANIDVWESRGGRGRDEMHVKRGKEATVYLISLLKADSEGRPWKRRWLRSHKGKKATGNFGRYLFEMFLDDQDGNTYSVTKELRAHGYEKQK